MDQKLCISKKITYIGIFFILVIGFVILGQLVLQSNQATNSRASETKQVVEAPSAPPTSFQLQTAISLQASQNSEGNIELFGTPPQIVSESKYTVYLKKSDGVLVHIKTFTATQEQINMLFSEYWSPNVSLSTDDIKNGTFYLYQTN